MLSLYGSARTRMRMRRKIMCACSSSGKAHVCGNGCLRHKGRGGGMGGYWAGGGLRTLHSYVCATVCMCMVMVAYTRVFTLTMFIYWDFLLPARHPG